MLAKDGTPMEQLMRWLKAFQRMPERRAEMLLYSSLAFNLVYAAANLIAGGWYHSPWMIGLGGYHGMLAIMRFHLMRRIRKGTDEGKWKAYRGTAFMLLALTAVIGGIVTATFLLNKTYDYPGMLVYAFAVFAFGKIISVSVSLIKKRHEENRVLAAARCVSFAHALMSILALQVALINRFGADDPGFARTMNGIIGAVICLLVIGMSVYMLIKSGKALKRIGGIG